MRTMPDLLQHRIYISALLILTISSKLFLANSLSTPPAIGRVHTPTPSHHVVRSSLFPHRSVGGRARYLKPTYVSASNDQFKRSNVYFIKSLPTMSMRLGFVSIPNISRQLKVLRQYMLKTMAILSFAMLGFASISRPAFAAERTKNVVVAAAPKTPIKNHAKITKVVVTAASVIAGAAAANKVRALSQDDEDTSNSTDIPDSREPTPGDTLPAESEKPKEKSIPPKENMGARNKLKPNSPLVKDLDAKIERLKEQEKMVNDAVEQAREKQVALEEAQKKEAEQKAAKEQHERRAAEEREAIGRMEKLAQEEEEKKRKEAVAAQMEKIAQEEAQKKAADEKAAKQELERKVVEEKEAQEKLALDEANKEKWRLEQIAKSQGMDVETLEELVQETESKSKPAGSGKSSMPRDVEWARKQPKLPEEEEELKEKYGAMEIEERAFNILVDLGVEVNSDLAPLDWEDTENGDVDSGNVFL